MAFVVVFVAGLSGLLHYLQLASHELATIGINVTKNKIPIPIRCVLGDYGPTFLLTGHSSAPSHHNHPTCLDKPNGLYPILDCQAYCQDGRNLENQRGIPKTAAV